MAISGFAQALLGIDAREPGLTGLRGEESGPGRPEEFLLRTDLDDVLSADTMVWPSIFDSGLSKPEWIGMNVPFWEDLGALQKSTAQSDSNQPFWLIAATWHTDLGFQEEARQPGKFLGPYLTPTTPEHTDAAWRFPGFDIADGGFISGLSNCGYDDERDRLAAEWARDLNRYHLFEDIQRAFQFRVLTNARVPEHAPFFVIGLWLISGLPVQP